MVSSPSGRRGSSLLGRAHHQGGWGRLSDDRPGQHNPDSSEDPWGGGLPTLHGGASARNRPDTERDIRGYDGMHEGRKQTNTWSAYAGSRLELSDALGRRRPKRHPSSRTGENPPYGMIGGIEETSASFEARSAPRSYPTAGALSNERPYRARLSSSCVEAVASQGVESEGNWRTAPFGYFSSRFNSTSAVVYSTELGGQVSRAWRNNRVASSVFCRSTASSPT
jgi:hypothetical protein